MADRLPTSETAKAEAEKKKRAARLRAAGFRPVRIWVPDVREPGFAEEVRRQSLRVSRSAGEEDTLSFIEAVGDFSNGSDPRKE